VRIEVEDSRRDSEISKRGRRIFGMRCTGSLIAEKNGIYALLYEQASRSREKRNHRKVLVKLSAKMLLIAGSHEKRGL